ncbi:hypothetical protein [Lederbergia lenta]|uniref:Copper amine oxidase-like N-terminal domain-containing protein n=1 Tax=Lederbergia lenta TaxID=1467 RepID=A0A2X4Z861_LEDLE|nr:hypothetical protein [Lederbergia lenta]SQI60525.1 Uncharacterised protein [Lederbergia lenta]
MKKPFFTFILMLLILTSSLIFWQWKGYSSSEDKVEEKLDIQQTININHQKEGLFVEQIISNIEETSVKLSIPSQVIDITCGFDQAKCEWTDQKEIQLAVDEGRLIFHYSLPIPQSADSFLLNNWTVKLHNQSIASTKIQLSETQWRSGSWQADAKLNGLKEMNLVDYYVFEKFGEAPLLYWQREKLMKKKEIGQIAVYAEQDFNVQINEIPAIHQLKDIQAEQPIKVIITKLHKEIDTETLKIINSEKKLTSIQEEMVYQQLVQLFQFPKKERWLVGVITSSVLNKPVGEEKAQKMYLELKDTLGKEQLSTWLDRVFEEKDNKINSKTLDDLIEAPLGMNAKFFSVNAVNKDSIMPLTFIDARDIYVNENKSINTNIVTHEGKKYINFLPILEESGYQVTNKKNEGILVEKEAVKYQFYPDKRIFLLGEKKYGMKESPVVLFHNTAYIELGLLNTFFNWTILEEDSQINIFQSVE